MNQPAFPSVPVILVQSCDRLMTEHELDQLRETVSKECHNGMTLRDWFAGMALSNPYITRNASMGKSWSQDAYELADEMLIIRGSIERKEQSPWRCAKTDPPARSGIYLVAIKTTDSSPICFQATGYFESGEWNMTQSADEHRNAEPLLSQHMMEVTHWREIPQFELPEA